MAIPTAEPNWQAADASMLCRTEFAKCQNNRGFIEEALGKAYSNRFREKLEKECGIFQTKSKEEIQRAIETNVRLCLTVQRGTHYHQTPKPRSTSHIRIAHTGAVSLLPVIHFQSLV